MSSETTETMDSRLVELLRCPQDGGRLLLQPGNGHESGAFAGRLLCAACGSEIPMAAGILRFLTAERNNLCALQKSEMQVRDRDYRAAAAEFCRGRVPGLGAFDVPEFDAVRRALGDCRGRSVLDAGCGAGKLTPAVRNAESYLGVDLSWEGLMNFQKPSRALTALAQADVTRLPVASGAFDVALGCQIVSHLPTPELRSRFVAEMARALKPSGRLILTAMHYSFRYRNRQRPREGVEGGSYFHRFEVAELRALLSERFSILSLRGYWIYLPKTYRLFVALGTWKKYSDRMLRALPLSLTYGKYLLAVCAPKP
ncbi:MAG TPA: class I SAM-dependent methyltransferase [Candidatus Acidoferrales bacterium]|nr:class I SAM-dependent methyltransferase [Candidatus Acidoferrales bacterium]